MTTLAYIGIICALLGLLAALLSFLAYYTPRYGVVLLLKDGGATMHSFYTLRGAHKFAEAQYSSARQVWLHDLRRRRFIDTPPR